MKNWSASPLSTENKIAGKDLNGKSIRQKKYTRLSIDLHKLWVYCGFVVNGRVMVIAHDVSLGNRSINTFTSEWGDIIFLIKFLFGDIRPRR